MDQEAQREYIEEQYALSKSALETYLANVENGTEEFNESIMRSLLNNANAVYTQGKEIGANVGDGMIFRHEWQEVLYCRSYYQHRQ